MENTFEDQVRAVVDLELENDDIPERNTYLFYLAGGQVLEGQIVQGCESANPMPDDGFQILSLISYIGHDQAKVSGIPYKVFNKHELLTLRYSMIAGWARVRLADERLEYGHYVS